MKTETLILHRHAFTYEPAGSDNRVALDRSHQIDRHHVGETFTTYVGAPGTGCIVYRITRIDRHGMWGIVLSDTVRILDPAEVR
jgi:hypothetical protein